MSEGKKIAQACHASLGAFEKAERDAVDSWKGQGMKKIVLKVSSEEELIACHRKAGRMDIPSKLVRDAGRTELEPGTATCVGLGPDIDERIDSVTGSLDIL